MKVRPNPRYKEFVVRLPPLFAHMTPWRGITFRSVDLAYASPAHMLSGEGSLKAGGRWNAPGLFQLSTLVRGQERLSKKHFSSPPTFILSPTI